MRIDRNAIVTGVAVVLAYGAGRLALVEPGDPALAAPPPEEAGIPATVKAAMEAGTPGVHHKHLEVLVGEWDMVVRMWSAPDAPVAESSGLLVREWVLDHRYLREQVTAEAEWGSFAGVGYMGYNNVDGQYEGIWMDNQSTAIMQSSGSYDPARKAMSFRATHRDPATRTVAHTRATFDLSNPDRHVFVEYKTGADGKEFKVFEGVAERRRRR